MSKFTISYQAVVAAAAATGKTLEDYISSLASVNLGFKVCAHLDCVDSGIAHFSFDREVCAH